MAPYESQMIAGMRPFSTRHPDVPVDPIRAAVQAERARCAKIAREIAEDPHGSNPSCAAAEEIAARIEAGE